MILEITRKRLFLIGSFIVVLIAIPLTVYVTQKQQEIRSQAATVPESTVIVTIDGQDFTKADIREVANEQYESSAVDDQALKDALDVLIERTILDIEAERLGVEADSDYEVLQEKITLAATKSRKVLSLGFWSPKSSDQGNLDASEKEIARTITSQGRAALSEIETRLSNGEDVVEIADAILVKYPALEDYLAINGYRLIDLSEDEKQAFASPDIVEFGDSNMDGTVLNGVFALGVGEIKKFQATETNDGGWVFKLLEKGKDTGPSTYSAWLTERRNALVTPRGSL